MEILNVEKLMFTYPNENIPALSDISFCLNEGSFTLLCGATGSGKSTLLKLLKPEISLPGVREGRITVLGEEIKDGEEIRKNRASRVGYVCQNPKEQAVTDKVWHELAFGLENMNLTQNVMAAKVAEIASYFGIEDWFEKRVDELSGGQLQILNLASVMVMDPEILILDEPSAQLDPVSASEFFMTLKKLNTDFSLTVLIAEHRLEELFPLCDNVMVMNKGRIVSVGEPSEVISDIKTEDELFNALPAAYRLFGSINIPYPVKDIKPPITVREGREFIYRNKERIAGTSKTKNEEKKEKALEFTNVSFRYSRSEPDALKGLSFSAFKGEIFCILGGNGSGKTTALSTAAGLAKPYEGSVKIFGKKISSYKNQSLYNNCLSMLPQDVQTLFLHNTVREELESRRALDKIDSFPFDIKNLLNKHPYDLSGGEQQLLALAIVLNTEPKLLLLDEPTKGLDAYRKKVLSDIIKKLKADGVTIVAVTHDVEFAALCADRCSLFFKGSAVACGDMEGFFYGNSFYTTSVCRMSRGIVNAGVTVEELAKNFR